MSSYDKEKMLRAHIELIEEAGEYASYFSQSEPGAAWLLADVANKDAAQALLDAKVVEIVNQVGPENPNGTGPSDFDEYTPIHFDDNVEGVNYRAWFVKDGKYYKADNGNSNTIQEIADQAEIDSLIEASGFVSE